MILNIDPLDYKKFGCCGCHGNCTGCKGLGMCIGCPVQRAMNADIKKALEGWMRKYGCLRKDLIDY